MLLLHEEGVTSAAAKQRIAYVICHELAHQWFGNLVTMEWWTDLWLNEGFATWVGWLAVDHLFPYWNTWEQFVIGETCHALNLDGLKSSHPIQVEVNKASEIDEIFDAISYSKGASVIRMLANYLGEDVFQTGLRAYLKSHMYGNAKTADLWSALAKTSGKPVAAVMDSWTKQMGYPVLKVSRNDALDVVVEQSRFLSSGKKT